MLRKLGGDVDRERLTISRMDGTRCSITAASSASLSEFMAGCSGHFAGDWRFKQAGKPIKDSAAASGPPLFRTLQWLR